MKAECSCGAAYKLPDKFAGKRVKCKKCGQAFKVPELGTLASGDDLLSMDASSLGVPVERKSNDERAKQKRAKEDALLAKFEGKTSTEDFIANNCRDALLQGRHDRAVYKLFFGAGLILPGSEQSF